MIFLSSWIKRMEYYLKMIVIVIGTMTISTVFTIPYIFFRPKDYRNGYPAAWTVKKMLELILGHQYEIRGTENIDTAHGSVVLINHQSFIDVGVLCSLWPIIGKLTIVSKNFIRYAYPPSYFYGTLFIDRKDLNGTRAKLDQQSRSIREKSSKLIMFPEGTRNQSGKLLPFKKGPFHVAITSQCTIQPVVVSRYDFLDSKRKRFGKGRIVISILPEIDCSQLEVKDLNRLLDDTHRTMQNELDLISSKNK